MTKPLTIFQAEALLQDALDKHRIDLMVLVAETSIWAHPSVHHYLLQNNGTGAWRPNTRRARPGERRRSIDAGVLLDDNTFANTYIKAAAGLSRNQVVGYETCHIWPRTCYDPGYHTTIANLVLLPRALAGLTDHSRNVLANLQYRSFELYGFHPIDTEPPTRPTNYPSNWREVMPFSERVKQSLARRAWEVKNKQVQEHSN